MAAKYRNLSLLSGLLLFVSCIKEQDSLPGLADSVHFNIQEAVSISATKSVPAEEAVEDLPGSDGMLLVTHCEDMPLTLPDRSFRSDTKATPYGSASDMREEPFGLVAYTYDTDGAAASAKTHYAGPASVSYDNTAGKWLPDTPLYWPRAGKYIQFYAYTPASAARTVTAESGSNPTVSYTVPSEVGEQRGFLVADPVQRRDNPASSPETDVQLTFRHVLSGVRFRIDEDYDIESITLSGIPDTGTYLFDEGTWTGLSHPASFTLNSPSRLSLTTNEGYKVYEPFLMIPQTLPAGASVTIRVNGENFVINMEGRELQKGKLITYTFTYGNIFHVSPPTDMTWEGGISTTATVVSYVRRAGGLKRAEPWTIQGFYASEANAQAKTSPLAIGSTYLTSISCSSYDGGWDPATFTIHYKRNTSFTLVPEVVDVDAAINTELSQNVAVGSAGNYWNLANPADGGDNIVESANSYIVNAAGYYRIPLVVGNGVKNNAINGSAFGPDNFKDYKGQTIVSPYLHKTSTSAGTPTRAFILWEERKSISVVNETDWVLADGTNGITSTGSGDAQVYWLNFHIDKSDILQGNAVIAVADEENNIMWSWHIWLTSYVPANYGGTADLDVYPQTADAPSQGYYTMMPYDLGWVESKNKNRLYAARTVYVRLEQTTAPDKYYCIMPVTSKEGVVPGHARGHCPYYQWGRKDALQPSNGESNTNLTCYGKQPSMTLSTGSQNLEVLIKNPWIYYPNSVIATNTTYKNWWSVGNTSTAWSAKPVVKSIYDPCPAGYHVAEGGAFTGFTRTGEEAGSTTNMMVSGAYNEGGFNGWCFWTHGADSPTIFFAATGCRTYDENGNLYSVAQQGYAWSAQPAEPSGSYNYVYYLGYNGSIVLPHRHNTYRRGAALAIRPVRDY